MIDPELLSFLVCPVSRAPFIEDGNRLVSRDPESRRAYDIVDGIPKLLPTQGQTLTPEEHAAVLRKHASEPWRPASHEVTK